MKLKHQMLAAAAGTLLAPTVLVLGVTLYEAWADPTDGVFKFQDDAVDGTLRAKANRVNLGTQTWESGDRAYALTVESVGFRPSGAKFFPTDAEFDDWLALPDWHEFATDLDGYLESVQ